MFVHLVLIALAPDQQRRRDALIPTIAAAAPGLGGILTSWVAPVEGPVINAGQIVWRSGFASEGAAAALPLDPVWRSQIAPLLDGAQMTTLGYRITRSAVRQAEGGIWRALIFQVMPRGFPDIVQRLESGLLLMPRYVPTIRSWALSPVATSSGGKAFTHVWEQEFEAIEGLTGPYMTDPVHWGVADAFFDAEHPDYIVDPQLIQVIGRIDRTIILPAKAV